MGVHPVHRLFSRQKKQPNAPHRCTKEPFPHPPVHRRNTCSPQSAPQRGRGRHIGAQPALRRSHAEGKQQHPRAQPEQTVRRDAHSGKPVPHPAQNVIEKPQKPAQKTENSGGHQLPPNRQAHPRNKRPQKPAPGPVSSYSSSITSPEMVSSPAFFSSRSTRSPSPRT